MRYIEQGDQSVWRRKYEEEVLKNSSVEKRIIEEKEEILNRYNSLEVRHEQALSELKDIRNKFDKIVNLNSIEQTERERSEKQGLLQKSHEEKQSYEGKITSMEERIDILMKENTKLKSDIESTEASLKLETAACESLRKELHILHDKLENGSSQSHGSHHLHEGLTPKARLERLNSGLFDMDLDNLKELSHSSDEKEDTQTRNSKISKKEKSQVQAVEGQNVISIIKEKNAKIESLEETIQNMIQANIKNMLRMESELEEFRNREEGRLKKHRKRRKKRQKGPNLEASLPFGQEPDDTTDLISFITNKLAGRGNKVASSSHKPREQKRYTFTSTMTTYDYLNLSKDKKLIDMVNRSVGMVIEGQIYSDFVIRIGSNNQRKLRVFLLIGPFIFILYPKGSNGYYKLKERIHITEIQKIAFPEKNKTFFRMCVMNR